MEQSAMTPHPIPRLLSIWRACGPVTRLWALPSLLGLVGFAGCERGPEICTGSGGATCAISTA
ncbi:hypothetical protein pthi1_p21 [Paracoccus phage vB_PthS_Pthi1]|nr:hypothetical protein pthi1_p21 [Paracoccus phage vB_PthS_Pthi1]